MNPYTRLYRAAEDLLAVRIPDLVEHTQQYCEFVRDVKNDPEDDFRSLVPEYKGFLLSAAAYNAAADELAESVRYVRLPLESSSPAVPAVFPLGGPASIVSRGDFPEPGLAAVPEYRRWLLPPVS